jgi:hypothetical protein
MDRKMIQTFRLFFAAGIIAQGTGAAPAVFAASRHETDESAASATDSQGSFSQTKTQAEPSAFFIDTPEELREALFF